MAGSSNTRSDTLNSIKRHQYSSNNILQSYDVLVPVREPSTVTSHPYFIVYIHGGYFRDPKVDSTSLEPSISLIEDSQDHAQLRSQISGYASLNYRLSPHPDHPQNPASTPADNLNTARWPDQPNDILAALQHLQREYPTSREYVLAGHSVGATLAFLTVLRAAGTGVVPPRAVIGVSGIYDFIHIHKSHPDYEGMTRNAMTVEQYEEASPALFSADDYLRRWRSAEGLASDAADESRKSIMLAHSKDDGLVDWDQVTEMHDVFAASELQIKVLELHGRHNEIWENGTELVRTFEEVMRML